MTEEELDLYKRLQPVFEKKMGPWQKFEAGWDNKFGYCIFMGGDVFLYLYPDGMATPFIHERTVLRLPLPIDPRNPERGLVGMIKGFIVLQAMYQEGDYIAFGQEPMEWACETDGGQDIGETPTLALLRALAAQEGV